MLSILFKAGKTSLVVSYKFVESKYFKKDVDFICREPGTKKTSL